MSAHNDRLAAELAEFRAGMRTGLLELKASVLEVRASLAEYREQQARANVDISRRIDQAAEILKSLRDHGPGSDK